MSIIKIFGKIYERYVKNYLYKNFPKNSFTLPVFYTLGKVKNRFRSATILILSQGFSGEISKVIPLSAAAELRWAISIVEDDIVDKDVKRYGVTSAWKKFGLEKSILSAELSGFYLLNFIEEIPYEKKKIKDEFLQTNKNLYKGVLMERENIRNFDISSKEILKIYEYKMFPEIDFPKIAGLVIGVSEETLKKIIEYNKYLAFSAQINTDLSDISKFKEKSSDILNGYVTYPIIKLLNKIGDNEKKEFQRKYKNPQDNLSSIFRFFERNEIFPDCKKDATNYAIEALKIVKSFDIKYKWKKILEEWAKFHMVA